MLRNALCENLGVDVLGSLWSVGSWVVEKSSLAALTEWVKSKWKNDLPALSAGKVSGSDMSLSSRVPAGIATWFVGYLHQRWFSDDAGTLYEDYRVSLFVPENDGLKCMARSRSAPSTHKWNKSPPGKVHWEGVVQRTLREQAATYAIGLEESKRGNEQERRAYRDRTYVDEQTWADRSWKWATIRTRLIRSDNGDPLCVVVVERQSGRIIEVKNRMALKAVNDGWEDDDACALELELAGDVLAAVLGNSYEVKR